jgi:hypothetical protein
MHSKVKEAYRVAGFQIPANPADTNEEIFRRKTKRARPEDVRVVINQVWRTSQGAKKDFIFYEKKEIIPDLAGNDDTCTIIEGKLEMPKFRNVYNNQTGDVESVALAGFETEYDIPYSKENMNKILTEAEVEREGQKPIKVPVDSTNTVFTLVVGGRKYGAFSAEDFVERSFDELTQLALYGTYQEGVQNVKPQVLRANDDAEFRKRRLKQMAEEEEIALEQAYDKVHEREEAQKREFETYQKEVEEEAKKRQEAVDQQSEKRVIRAEATAQFNKEEAAAPAPAEVETTTADVRPEREMINEEVKFVLSRPEDQNVNEDEEIQKGFKELEESKKSHKKK